MDEEDIVGTRPPHSSFGESRVLRLSEWIIRGDQVEIVCNECGAVIRALPADELEAALRAMAQTDTICTATCPHCGARNAFPGFASIAAYICRECGAGVDASPPVQ